MKFLCALGVLVGVHLFGHPGVSHKDTKTTKKESFNLKFVCVLGGFVGIHRVDLLDLP